MKLFIIELNEDVEGDYDEFDGFVIRAESEDNAWTVAEKLVKDSVWNVQRAEYFNKDTFLIKELNVNGEEEIILASYNAG